MKKGRGMHAKWDRARESEVSSAGGGRSGMLTPTEYEDLHNATRAA